MAEQIERTESLRMEMFTANEVGLEFLKRKFTENEKLQLMAGKALHWKGMDLGGDEKKDFNVKMQTFINDGGKLEKGFAVQLKAPKLEIPDKILGKKLNKREKETLKEGNFFSLERDSGVYMVKVDTQLNAVTIRTPQELGIREELGGYKFDKVELERLANGQNVGPKVYTSDRYGDFVANLQIKQQGQTNEYTYTNINNVSKKEAAQLRPLLNDNKGEWVEKDIDKVLDIMGLSHTKKPELIESVKKGRTATKPPSNKKLTGAAPKSLKGIVAPVKTMKKR